MSDYKKEFAKNLNRIMELNGKKQVDLINDLHLSSSTVSNWCTGLKLPRPEKIEMLCNYFNCTHIDLVGFVFDSNGNYISHKIGCQESTRIPVLGSIPAGIPIEAIQDIIDYEEIDSDIAAKGEYFALKIKGDSMEPRICEGDVVIVRKQDDVESGDIAIVMVNGNDATIKRLLKYQDGIRLMPSNPTYDPIYFTNQEILEKPVKVIGKVIENRQKY